MEAYNSLGKSGLFRREHPSAFPSLNKYFWLAKIKYKKAWIKHGG